LLQLLQLGLHIIQLPHLPAGILLIVPKISLGSQLLQIPLARI